MAGCLEQQRGVVGGGSSSQLQATSITSIDGSEMRCDDIYPDMYERSKEIFSTMIQRYNQTFTALPEKKDPRNYLFLSFENGANKAIKAARDSSPVTDDQARHILVNTYQMLLNMTRNRERPIDPAGFFATIKDFESAMDMDEWSSGPGFLFSTPHCSPGRCYGYFQIGLQHSINNGTWNAERLCGQGGLGLIGKKGGMDFCASQFWWTKNNASKCERLSTQKVAGRYPNPCIDKDFSWTPDTFAYAWKDAYVQQNQWGHYGIQDSWKKMYTGLKYKGMDHLGYEQCAVQHYLKRFMPASAKETWLIPTDFDGAKYIGPAVRHFLFEIGVVPGWSTKQWHPRHARPGVDFPSSVTIKDSEGTEQKILLTNPLNVGNVEIDQTPYDEKKRYFPPINLPPI